MPVWIRMYVYYTNIGTPGIIVCLYIVTWDRTVGCGNAEGILRCCKCTVGFLFLTEILLRL